MLDQRRALAQLASGDLTPKRGTERIRLGGLLLKRQLHGSSLPGVSVVTERRNHAGPSPRSPCRKTLAHRVASVLRNAPGTIGNELAALLHDVAAITLTSADLDRESCQLFDARTTG